MIDRMFFDAEKLLQENSGVVSPIGMQNSDAVFAFYADDAGGALKVIDKGLAIGYAELGLLDPMEIEGTSHGGIEYRFPPTKS